MPCLDMSPFDPAGGESGHSRWTAKKGEGVVCEERLKTGARVGRKERRLGGAWRGLIMCRVQLRDPLSREHKSALREKKSFPEPSAAGFLYYGSAFPEERSPPFDRIRDPSPCVLAWRRTLLRARRKGTLAIHSSFDLEGRGGKAVTPRLVHTALRRGKVSARGGENSPSTV